MITTMNLFSGKVCQALSRTLGDDYEVKLQEITKNNGVKLCGVVILTKQQNISPTIYLEPYLENYNDGDTLSDIVRRIIEIYRGCIPDRSEDFSFFRDFDQVRDRICFRLVNREKNAEILEQIPHVDFLDLSICFFYAHDSRALGTGCVRIYNHHMTQWGCSVAQLLKLAQRNTPAIFPGQVLDMTDILRESLEEAGEDVSDFDLPQEICMKVMTNDHKLNGATVLLYPDMLRDVAAALDANLYVLPSSVHEVIVLPEDGQEECELRRMVSEVNETQVSPEEVLSDEVYFYDRRLDQVSLLRKGA